MESRLIIVGANKNDVVLNDLLKKVLKIKPEQVVLTWQYNNEKGVIVALGMDAVESVIGKSKEKISKLRGEFITTENYQLMPTFSTNYAIRSEANLKLLAEDIDKAFKLLNGLELTQAPKQTNTTMLTTYTEVEQLVEYIKETGVCAFDYETTGLDIFSDDFAATMISFSFQHGSSYTIPLDHYQSPMEPKERLRSLKLLKTDVFNNQHIRKIGHNLKFDMHICRLYGLWPIRGRIDDSMLMAHLIDETNLVNLKYLVTKYVKKFANYEDALDKYNKNYAIIPIDELSQYAGIDTDVTFRLATLFESYLLKDMPLYTLYRNLQIPALRVLEDMEYKGVLIDKDGLYGSIMETQRLLSEQEQKMRGYDQVEAFEDHRLSEARKEAIAKLQERKDKLTADLEAKGKTTNKTLETVEQKLTALKTGAELPKYEPFNFGSPKQLTELLFESKKGFKFKLPKDNKGVTMKGTGKEVVTQLKDESGFINDLLIFRGVKTVLGTFLQGIYDKLDSKNLLHTQYKQLVASGRISSTSPNLQNVPSNSKLSDETSKIVTSFVKKAFIVPEGQTLIALDYSQAELRVVASFANEKAMLTAYENDQDLHAVTAANMLKLSLEAFYELDKDTQKKWRTRAKAGNFGLLYGMSAGGFKDYARNNYGVELTDKEAEDTRKLFFQTYPNLLEYHATYIAKARKFGYVRTLFGRKRHTPDIHSSDNMKRSNDERVSINSPIQGTAGEFTIFALALLYNRLDPRVQIANSVHDSIILYCPDELLEETIELLRLTCENLPTEQYFGKSLRIGMKVDIETSKTHWGDLKS